LSHSPSPKIHKILKQQLTAVKGSKGTWHTRKPLKHSYQPQI
jgi:hypothetical protein